MRARVGLEGQCVRLGRMLGAQGPRLVLFVFDFGDGGNLAWWSNVESARGVVNNFLRTVAD